MRKSKFLAIILTLAIIMTQFTVLGGVMSVSATSSYSALTGRSDFDFGINIHQIQNYAAYTKTYDVINDSKSLGANLIRIGYMSDENGMKYLNDVISVAQTKGINVMVVDGTFKTFVRNQSDNYATAIAYNSIDTSAIATYYTNLATRYNGKVKYYQLGNELDNMYKYDSVSGKSTLGYDDVKGLATAIYTAANAIHAVDSSAKVVVNFSWTHYGFIEKIKDVKLNATTGMYDSLGTATATWDLTGMDFYKATDSSDSYPEVFSALADYDEDIIVTEANVKATGWNENNHDEVYYNGDASWLGDFVVAAYNNSKVKGFIPYEIYDEPAHTDHGVTFHEEAFFGLIDRNGVKKDTYDVVKTLYGGTEQARTSATSAPAVNTIGTLEQNVYSALHTDTMQTKLQRSSDATFLTIENLTSTAFDQMKTIEFDVFIEDKDAFDAVVKNNNMTLKAIINDTNNGTREAKDLPLGLIYQSGWNHIVLTRNHFSQGSGQYWANGIKKFTFGFGGANQDQYSALSGMNIAVANLCVTDVTTYTTSSIVGEKIATQPTTASKVTLWGGTSGSNIKKYRNIFENVYDNYFGPKDLSEADYLEFDLYIPNVEEYFASMPSNAYLTLYVGFTDQHSRWNRCLMYNINNQITKNGWNHILINFSNISSTDATAPVASDASNSRTGAQVKAATSWLYFSYTNATVTNENPLWDYTFAISDFIATKKVVPSFNTTASVISTLTTTGISHTIGAQYNYVGDNFKQVELTAQDFSNADYIEFDCFVPNYETLKADMDAKGITNMALRLSSNASSPDSNQATLTFFNDKITKSGWNHIVLKKSDFATSGIDWSNIQSYKIYSNGSNTKVACAQANQTLTFANIEATGVIKPSKQNVAAKEKTVVFSDMSKINIGSDFTTKIDNSSIGTKDISEAEYIELDLYVENKDAFLSAITANNAGRTLDLRISSSTTNDKSYQSKTVALNSYITNDGWNHIKLPISAFAKGNTSGNIDLSAVNYYNFFFNGNQNDVNAAQGQIFAIANISATADGLVRPAINNTANWQKSIILDSMTDITLGTNFTTHIEAKGIDPVDISGTEYIEFDLYVEDKDALQSAIIANNENRTLCLRISSSETSDISYQSLTSTVAASYITKNGWNHIALPMSGFIKGSTSGAIDLSAIRNYNFFFNGTGTDANAAAGQSFAVANVTATANVDTPSVYATGKTDIISDALTQVSFDGEGLYQKDLDASIDVSGKNMIEFDLYTDISDFGEFTFGLIDSAGNMGTFTTTCSNIGWNHYYIRISDLECENTLDTSAIASVVLVGTSDASCFVSNMNASEYTIGDADRNGVVNILDIVAAKKYVAAQEGFDKIKVNLCAIDLDGNDYQVLAADITSLINILLAN